MSMESVYFRVDRLRDAHDAKALKRALDSLPGVISVSISQEKHTVAVDYDSTGVQEDRLRQTICGLGYSQDEPPKMQGGIFDAERQSGGQ